MATESRNLFQGPARVYVGAFGAVEPANTLAAINAAPNASAWTEVGLTQGGVTLNMSSEYAELEADQIAFRAGSALVSESASVTVNMAEPTLDNLVLALNDDPTSITSGSDYRLYTPKTGDADEFDPLYKAVILWGNAPKGTKTGLQKRMVILRRVLSTEGTEISFSKTDQTVFSVTFTAHYINDTTKPFVIKDAVAAS